MADDNQSADVDSGYESDGGDPLEGYSETEFLEDILAPVGSAGLTAEKLLSLDEKCMLQYALIIFSHIGQLGAIEPNSPRFASLLNAFCARAMASRPLKLRAALLMQVADIGVSEYWHPHVLYDPTCYERDVEEPSEGLLTSPTAAAAAVTAQLQLEDNKDASIASTVSIANVDADALLKDDHLLVKYAERRFFHPKNGIALKTKRRGLRTFKDSFSEYVALLFIMQDLSISEKSTASAVGTRMEQLKLIKRASTLPQKPFGFGRNLFVRCLPASRVGRARSVVAIPASDINAGISVTFGLDVLDMQSINFWRSILWDKPLEEGSDFGAYAIVHPMAVSSSDLETAAAGVESAASYGGFIAVNVEVKKVFSSMAKPGILCLSSHPPGSVLIPSDKASKVEIEPRVIAKTGDNLLNDMSVELVFRVFNHVWRQDVERFGGADRAPFSFAYDVLPTGTKTGLLEFIAGIAPLNDYDWSTWMAENKQNSEVLDTMLRSAAGCSIAQYVMGCGDRHFDNIQIKDGRLLLHIDFGMILGENPAFKTPRFSISQGMENAFKDVGIWEPFVELCGAAFLSLRDRSSELTRLIALLLHHAGRSSTNILKYLASKESFNIAEADEVAAKKFVCDQVISSSKNWETILRKFTHDKVDPLFFKLAEAAPKSLVSAVEKMYDK